MSVPSQSTGVFEDPVLRWRRFDALPVELRRVYALAPFEMHMGTAAKRLDVYRRHGASLANMRKAEIFYLAKYLQQECLAEYGPDHPDAQRSRLEGRARKALRPHAVGGNGRRA